MTPLSILLLLCLLVPLVIVVAVFVIVRRLGITVGSISWLRDQGFPVLVISEIRLLRPLPLSSKNRLNPEATRTATDGDCSGNDDNDASASASKTEGATQTDGANDTPAKVADMITSSANIRKILTSSLRSALLRAMSLLALVFFLRKPVKIILRNVTVCLHSRDFEALVGKQITAEGMPTVLVAVEALTIFCQLKTVTSNLSLDIEISPFSVSAKNAGTLQCCCPCV